MRIGTTQAAPSAAARPQPPRRLASGGLGVPGHTATPSIGACTQLAQRLNGAGCTQLGAVAELAARVDAVDRKRTPEGAQHA